MAKIPVTPNLNRQDFPDAPDWISKLLYPLQLFMTSMLSALRNGLTLQDNFSCVVRDFIITAGLTDTDNTYSFPVKIGRPILELNAFCTNNDGSYTPVYPQVSWNYINENVVINGIKGLATGKKYNFTVTVK